MVWDVLGVLGCLIASACAFYLRNHHSNATPAELLRAFRALEGEFTDLQDHVDSHLGRISRLKRDVDQGKIRAVTQTARELNAATGDNLPHALPRTRSALLVRHKRNSGNQQKQ